MKKTIQNPPVRDHSTEVEPLPEPLSVVIPMLEKLYIDVDEHAPCTIKRTTWTITVTEATGCCIYIFKGATPKEMMVPENWETPDGAKPLTAEAIYQVLPSGPYRTHTHTHMYPSPLTLTTHLSPSPLTCAPHPSSSLPHTYTHTHTYTIQHHPQHQPHHYHSPPS